jgi:hypothetical protein
VEARGYSTGCAARAIAHWSRMPRGQRPLTAHFAHIAVQQSRYYLDITSVFGNWAKSHIYAHSQGGMFCG